jgi:hypothetical protein
MQPNESEEMLEYKMTPLKALGHQTQLNSNTYYNGAHRNPHS